VVCRARTAVAIPRRRREGRAAESLREVRAALVDFASAQDGAYPRQLETVARRVRLAAQARAERQLPSPVHARFPSAQTERFARLRFRLGPEIMASGTSFG